MTYLVRSLELILKHLRGPLPCLAAGQKPFLTTGTFNLVFKDRSTTRLSGVVSRERKPLESSLHLSSKIAPQQIALFLEANLTNISRLAEKCQPEQLFTA